MKKKKLHYYPSGNKLGIYSNPYSANFKRSLQRHYYVYEADNKKRFGLLSSHLLLHSFFADVFILNWIEKIGVQRYGWIQQIFAMIAIHIMRFRGKQIVWMFHNIHPHKGEQSRSREMQNFLFKRATLIISHSSFGAEFAKQRALCPVFYFCHPVSEIDVGKGKAFPCDVFIWGTILPYKGIAEFLEEPWVKKSDLRIHIVGACQDEIIKKRIQKCCSNTITYENRRAPMSDIAAFCSQSRYVLFPYISDSVSSSGALIDTIVLGGNPVGPNVGAFKDLEQEGVCFTYQDMQDLKNILNKHETINAESRKNFLDGNTWNKFAEKINKLINHEK